MSLSQISPASVLAAIRHGFNTRPLLAEHFEVLPTSHFLDEAITDLKKAGRVVEHNNDVLHVNDLIEQIPHDPEEGR